MANVIARLGRPALVLAPNKTLAAQRALADRLQPLAQEDEAVLGPRSIDELAAERILIATVMFVEHLSLIHI